MGRTGGGIKTIVKFPRNPYGKRVTKLHYILQEIPTPQDTKGNAPHKLLLLFVPRGLRLFFKMSYHQQACILSLASPVAKLLSAT